jgi:cytochrome c2
MPRPDVREREMADLLSFVATRGTAPGATTAYLEPGSPARGATVFRARGCGLCHAVRGVGGKTDRGAPPDLGRQPHALVRDYADVAAVLWNHAVPMWDRMRREGVPVRPLRGRDMADLVAYLFFVNFADEPGDATLGAQVFKSKRCSQCHAVSVPQPEKSGPQIGGRPRPDRPQDLIAAMWRAAPQMREEMRARRMDWPLFAPGELSHLIAYLRAQGGVRR